MCVKERELERESVNETYVVSGSCSDGNTESSFENEFESKQEEKKN